MAKLLRATVIVKQATRMASGPLAAFTLAGTASTLAEIAILSRRPAPEPALLFDPSQVGLLQRPACFRAGLLASDRDVKFSNRATLDAIIITATIAIMLLACSRARSEDLVARGVQLNHAEGASHCRYELAARMAASVKNSPDQTQAERNAGIAAMKSVVELCVALVDGHCTSEVMCAANVAVIRSDSFKLPPGEWQGLDVMRLTSSHEGVEFAVRDRRGCKLSSGAPVAVIGRSPLIVMGRSIEELRCVARPAQ